MDIFGTCPRHQHGGSSGGAAHAPEKKTSHLSPVVRQGFLDWLANDQRAFSHAKSVAEEAAAEMPGETIEAVAGEADVDLAIRDALATFPADEIVVAVRPRTQQGLVESMATAGAPTDTFDGIVRYVVIPDSSESPDDPR